MERREGLTVCLAVLVFAGGLAGVATVAGAGSAAAGTGGAGALAGPQAATGDAVRIDHEYRLTPGEPGRIDVRWTFALPDNVAELRTRLPAQAGNARLDGFVRDGDGLVWREDDRSTRTPSVTFTVPVNASGADGPAAASAPQADGGGLTFMDAGDWALVDRPRLAGVEFTYYGDQPAVTRTNSTAGPGVVGDAMLFLGPHEVTTRQAHGQRFRLVVPDAARLAEERSDVLASVAAAAGTLRVGDRDADVTMFAAPADAPWSVAGLQLGDSDFYALANQSLDTASNTWLHEYVHTRQAFWTATSTEWFTEASASYYAALLALDQERIEFPAFQRSLAVAERRYDDVVLADPSTWTNLANYEKGSLVAGQLDRRVRLATGGRTTLQSVFRTLNERRDQVTQSAFLQSVASAGNRSVRETARRYTETTAVPEMWSRASHRAAFDALPAEFTYGFPPVGSDRLRVRGPYRNVTATAEGLVVGETLVADVRVANVGGEPGTYDLTVRRNGSVVATRTGRLRPGQSTLETVRATFRQPGTYRLVTPTDHLTVGVFEPASVRVADLRVSRETAASGTAVDVTATVTNPGSKPATGVVAIRQGETTLLERRVYLDGGERTELATTVRVTEPGAVEFVAGAATATLSVTEQTATPGRATDTPADAAPGASGPGFGVAAALLALSLLAYRLE